MDIDKENEKVSIIVPIYNVERYIEKCVMSLIKQDYSNIEIILVNDGSPDHSAAIINQLALHDSRIQIIHKENGGVSSARNAGILEASGDYIMFVDGDDWVEPNYVSYFLNLLKNNNCSVGMDTKNFYAGSTQTENKTYTVSAEKAIEWIYMGKLFVAVWNKIYNTAFLKENAIYFNDEIWYGEGMLFNIEVLQFCDKVAIGEKSVYHQTVNPDSAMRSFNLKSNLCGIRSLELQKGKWAKVNDRIEKAWDYHRYCFNRSILDGLVRANMAQKNKVLYSECKSNIRKDIKLPLAADISLKQKLSWIAYAVATDMMCARSAKKFVKQIEKWGRYSENA